MAVASFVAVTAQVIGVSYLVNNKDKYLNQVREQVVEEVAGLIPDLLQSSMTEGLEVEPPLDNLNVNTPF